MPSFTKLNLTNYKDLEEPNKIGKKPSIIANYLTISLELPANFADRFPKTGSSKNEGTLMKRLIATICITLTSIGCNDSSFNEGAKAGGIIETPDSGDAVGSTADAPNQVNFQPEAVVEDSELQARNPASASDSAIFSFIASQEVNSSFKISLDDKMVMTEFTLTNLYSNREETKEQIKRTPLSETTQQGSDGKDETERFDQEEKAGLLDILVVIDDSGSMDQEQQNLATKLDDLLMYIAETDWQIGVVTTTPKNACEISIITVGENDIQNKFAAAVDAGTGGSGNEAGIKEAVNGLRCTENPWVRNDSSVAVLIVSDEDNCSFDGSDCQGEDWDKPQYLIDYVQNTLGRTVGQTAGFYGIFSDPADPCDTAFNNAKQYKELVMYNAGNNVNYGDICDASYATTLNKISENISGLLRNQFELKEKPSAGTLKVSVDLNGTVTEVNSGDYTLTGKTITFTAGKEPAADSVIIAEYKTGVEPKFKTYTLAETPAPGTLSITINNAPENNFTLAGQVVTFAAEPAASSNVKFDYLRNTPLLKEFPVAGTPRNNQVKVFVNDVESNDFAFDAANKKIVFNNAPTDGAVIKITFENLDGPNLSYNLPISGNNARDFKLFYNNAELNFQRNGTTITIGAGDHAENRKLVLRYEVDDDETKMFPLPETPIEQSLELVSSSNDCALGNGFEVVNGTLVSTCIVQELTEFELKYLYVGLRRNFVAPIFNSEVGRWTVYIDGIETTEFVRDGSDFEIKAEIPLGVRVDIYYEYSN